MNEETIIGFKEQTGLRISKCDITTGKVVVNGIEITSVEDWEKVTKSLIELQQENEKLNHYKLLYQKVKERIDKAIDFLENHRSGSDWYDTRDLLEILKGEK